MTTMLTMLIMTLELLLGRQVFGLVDRFSKLLAGVLAQAKADRELAEKRAALEKQREREQQERLERDRLKQERAKKLAQISFEFEATEGGEEAGGAASMGVFRSSTMMARSARPNARGRMSMITSVKAIRAAVHGDGGGDDDSDDGWDDDDI
jgi:cell division protein FtsB